MKNSIVNGIAHGLFLASYDALEYELTEHESFLLREVKPQGYLLDGNKLIFSSPECRDNFVAYYYFLNTDSESINASDVIIQTAFSIWEKSLRGDRKTAGLFLSFYENKIDIWKSLLSSKRNPYEITALADQFMKFMKDIDVQAVFNFVSDIYTHNDKYMGRYSSLESRLSDSPQKCLEIIKAFYSHIQPETLQLYTIALFSLVKKEHAYAIDTLIVDIEKNDSVLSPQSLLILGQIIKKFNYEYKNGKVSEVIESATRSSMLSISNAAMQAVVDSIDELPEMKFILRNLLDLNNQEVLKPLSRELFLTKELSSHTDFYFWMSCICKAAVGNDTLTELIFNTFSYLAKDESKVELLIDCLFVMIRNGSISDNNKDIDGFIYSIMRETRLLNMLFTLSLIEENSEHTLFSRLIAKNLFVHRSEHILECDIDVINEFREDEFIFLIRRILGFVSHENQSLSLILSLLKVKNAEKRTYDLVKAVVIDEIAMDYPGYVRDEILKVQQSIKSRKSKVAKLYDEILNELNSHINSSNNLPRIKEFEPSSLLVHAFQKEKARVATRKDDLNKENSFIFEIASRVILKAGVGSFYYNNFDNKGYSEPSYLHEFSSSYSLPRRYVMDNIGYDIRLRQYRYAKKEVL